MRVIVRTFERVQARVKASTFRNMQ